MNAESNKISSVVAKCLYGWKAYVDDQLAGTNYYDEELEAIEETRVESIAELEAWHQQEIAKARIDELNRIDAANKGNGISFWFESAQEAGLNNGWRTMREYVPERIVELSQTLKEHKEEL